MELYSHLRVIAYSIADLQGLLIPVLSLVELVLSMAHRTERVVDEHGVFFVTGFLKDLSGSLVPTGSFIVLEFVLGTQSEGPVILDHLLTVVHPLVYI